LVLASATTAGTLDTELEKWVQESGEASDDYEGGE
jgi:hypothetical protein